VHHGPPRALLSDPGGEFDSALWRTVAERHNITVYSTAAQAHFSNGMVERHNQTLKTMVARLRVDHPGAELQELLDLACLAKNSLGQHNGATPYQLMCGSTPRLPTAMTDELPALGDARVAGDKALHRHLDLLHSAREVHTRAEADASLRRALARNATNAAPCALAVGDAVYYWSDGITPGQGRWQGPAHVTDVAVAKDAVRLQHANQWVNRHTSQVRLVLPRPRSSAAPLSSAATAGASSTAAGPSAQTPVSVPTSSSHEAASLDDQTDDEAVASMLAGAAAALNRIAAEDAAPPPTPQPTPAPRWAGRTRATSHRAFVVARAARRTEQHGRSRDALRAALSKPDDLGGALHRDGAVVHQALVTRRELHRRAEVPVGLAGAAFDDAMTAELDAWSDLAVYAEVPYAGQVVLSTWWVLTIKEADSSGDAPRRKARLVVRGFEDPDRDSVDITSPTASRAGMRVALAPMAMHSFIPRTEDVRTAFLQGLPLDRPVAV